MLKLSVGVATEKNRVYRRTMEDRDYHCLNFNNIEGQALLAVFDGHAGSEASIYCEEHFHREFINQLLLSDEELDTNNKNEERDILSVFQKTFSAIDDQLKFTHAGCTAVVSYIQKESADKYTLYCANAGDARAVLCRNRKAVRLTRDHKGTDEWEAKRITDNNGFVFKGRVNGVLAVTRSLGDHAMKEHVVSLPFCTRTDLCPADTFLILACDGLWDVCEDQTAVDLVLQYKDPQKAADKLVEYALENNSTDNLSIMVLQIK
eukprot:NODE_1098_length_1206_cov_0.285456.p1 type:complete len:263 gc:universal NODE_1098_length_1206_cov_0.285456:1159-371(-)